MCICPPIWTWGGLTVVRHRAESYVCRNDSVGVQSYTAGWIGSIRPTNDTLLPHATCFNLRQRSCVKFLRSVGRGTLRALVWVIFSSHREGGILPHNALSLTQPTTSKPLFCPVRGTVGLSPPSPLFISREGWLKLAGSGAPPASCALPWQDSSLYLSGELDLHTAKKKKTATDATFSACFRPMSSFSLLLSFPLTCTRKSLPGGGCEARERNAVSIVLTCSSDCSSSWTWMTAWFLKSKKKKYYTYCCLRGS